MYPVNAQANLALLSAARVEKIKDIIRDNTYLCGLIQNTEAIRKQIGTLLAIPALPQQRPISTTDAGSIRKRPPQAR